MRCAATIRRTPLSVCLLLCLPALPFAPTRPKPALPLRPARPMPVAGSTALQFARPATGVSSNSGRQPAARPASGLQPHHVAMVVPSGLPLNGQGQILRRGILARPVPEQGGEGVRVTACEGPVGGRFRAACGRSRPPGPGCGPAGTFQSSARNRRRHQAVLSCVPAAQPGLKGCGVRLIGYDSRPVPVLASCPHLDLLAYVDVLLVRPGISRAQECA